MLSRYGVECGVGELGEGEGKVIGGLLGLNMKGRKLKDGKLEY